ncbi:uncharacterized protein LOC135831573 [Planococcus citri]|uniref:uncharacterized protein LOC135831573 n=1 Tax=Planococcus citri TaxID=170843 RepID=UPI0031F7F9A1
MGELTNLQEFPSFNYCLCDIPIRVRKGFTIVEVHYTCIDAVDEYIAIGTNIGIVYWANRSTNKVERLRPEKCGPKITFVSVISSVDYMVAAGDEFGTVSIFVVPKEKSFFMPTHNGKSSQKSIERFTVSDIHSSPITFLEWSLNGQKLFSGDERGLVVYTQMDFTLNIIKSTEILNEKFPIVQLSYCQPQILLIASEYRCIIYKQGNDSKTIQVGQKDRINLCKLGAIICTNFSSKPVIYSARPKQRIWLADLEGNVEKTLLFKEALAKDHSAIEVMEERRSHLLDNETKSTQLGDSVHQSTSSSISTPALTKAPEFEFNILKRYKDKFLLVYSLNAFALLNIENNTVEGGAYTLKKVISVAVNKEEVFILENHRKIRRLAPYPDKYAQLKNSFYENKDSQIGEKLLDIVSKIREEASNSMMKPVLNSISKGAPLEGLIDVEPISPAEDALLILSIDDEMYSSSSQNYHGDDQSSRNNPDGDIVFCRKKKHSPGMKRLELNEPSIGDVTSDMKELNVKDCDSDISFIDLKNNFDSGLEFTQENFAPTSSVITPTKEIPEDIAPDLRDIGCIMEDVEYKENRLKQLLESSYVSESMSNLSNRSFHSSSCADPVQEHAVSSSETNNDSDIISPEGLLNNIDENLCKNQLYCGCPNIENTQPENKHDNENPKEVLEQYFNEIFENPIQTEYFSENSNRNMVQTEHEDSWSSWYLPNVSKWICVTNSGIYYGGAKSTVYYSETKDLKLNWKIQNYRAVKMSVSLDGSILWKIDLGVAYAYSTDLVNRWKTIARNVESVAVNENSAWYLSDGNIHVQFDLTAEKPFSEKSNKVPCPEKMSKIYCYENIVWGLTKKGKILCKNIPRDFDYVTAQWKNIPYPENLKISHLALGCKNTGWIITNNDEIHFTDNFLSSNEPDWWQVIVSNTNEQKNSNLTSPISKFVHWSKDRVTSSVASSDRAIWILRHGENILQVNKTSIEGHRWVPFLMDSSTSNLKWKFISGTGVLEKLTVLWCLSTNNDLFLLHPLKKEIRAVELPNSDDIICLSASLGSLWILTKNGEIYSRVGIKDENQFGSVWKPIIFKDANNFSMKFHYLSSGLDVIWAIDTKGEVFCAAGSPLAITGELHDPDWMHIKDVPSSDVKFTKVVVGPNSYMVWALDQKHNVYVRQGIFFDYLFGTAWIQVSGIKAINLVISSSAVWALTSEGTVFRRFGISQMNYIGDYWLQIPGIFSLIAASSNEELWGVSSVTKSLLKYETHVLDLLKTEEKKTRTLSETTDDGEWEFVDKEIPSAKYR